MQAYTEEQRKALIGRLNQIAEKLKWHNAAYAQDVLLAVDALNANASQPELTVWYGAMPESNGKSNWTAMLHRKGESKSLNYMTIDRSEYPERVRYAADRVRFLIGEISERPSILDYDADKHSGYVSPATAPQPVKLQGGSLKSDGIIWYKAETVAKLMRAAGLLVEE